MLFILLALAVFIGFFIRLGFKGMAPGVAVAGFAFVLLYNLIVR